MRVFGIEIQMPESDLRTRPGKRGFAFKSADVVIFIGESLRFFVRFGDGGCKSDRNGLMRFDANALTKRKNRV